MGINTDEWSNINRTTDNDTWTGGEYWRLSTQQWDKIYSKKHVSVHGDLYLAIDRVSMDVPLFPLSTDLWQMTVSDLRSNWSADQTMPRRIIKQSPDWISLFDRDDVPEQNGTSQRGVSLHIAQASSKKELNTPSTVQISLYFLIVVVCFNALKFIILLSVLITDRSAYLVTLGDAASSFLKREDPYTHGMCLLGREEILSNMAKKVDDGYYRDEDAEALRLRLQGNWLPRARPYLHKFGPSQQRFNFICFCL
jgi:hypothetical protein